MLAGGAADFTVTATEVFELKLPELNDEFAKSVGVESLEKLRELLLTNLKNEAEQKAEESAEIELLEKLVEGSKFSEIPDLLVNEEVRKMWNELQHAAEHQGMKMEDYMSHLKKSTDEMKMEMVPRAIERVQAAVLVKEIAKREQVEVPDKELEEEIDRILAGVKDKETETAFHPPNTEITSPRK